MQNPCRDTCTHGHTQPQPHLWPRIPFHLCMHQMSRHHQDVRCIAYIYIGIPTNTATTTNNNSKKKHKSSSNSSNIELSKWWNNTLCRTTLPALCAVVAARCTGCAGCAGGGPRAGVQVRCNTNVAGSARAVRPRWTRGRGGTGGPGWTEESRHSARAAAGEGGQARSGAVEAGNAGGAPGRRRFTVLSCGADGGGGVGGPRKAGVPSGTRPGTR